MFVALAELEESYFADRTSLFVAVGPVTKIPNTRIPFLVSAAKYYSLIADTLSKLKVYDVMNSTWLNSVIMTSVCGVLPDWCEQLLSYFTNSDPELDDDDRYAVYMGHMPNGEPTKGIEHYAQNMIEDRFQVWATDYSDFFKTSRKKHTTLIPIDTIDKVPVAIFAGRQDVLADTTDARWTAGQVKSTVRYQEIDAGHLTFLVGKDMSYFTNDVMSLMNYYSPLPSKDFSTDQFLQ